MRTPIGYTTIFIILVSCGGSVQNNETKSTTILIEGTWKLLTGTLIEKRGHCHYQLYKRQGIYQDHQ